MGAAAARDRNKQLNWSLLLCTAVVILVIYFPWFNPLFGTRILPFVHLLPALPFVVFMFVYDELRKWLIRRNPKGAASATRPRWRMHRLTTTAHRGEPE